VPLIIALSGLLFASSAEMILYKYSGEIGIKILDDLKVKVTPPNELNDPFEVTPHSRNEMTKKYILDKARNEPEHFRSVYNNLVEHENFKGSLQDVLDALHLMSKQTYSGFLDLYRRALIQTDLQSIQDASKHLVVLCLSEVNDSIPMWSHYADHHKGIVIGLDTSATCLTLGPPRDKVKYRARRVCIKPLTKPTPTLLNRMVADLVLTKSRVWEYEREHRICYSNRHVDRCIATPEQLRRLAPGNQSLYFVSVWSSVIKEVIFGCCVSNEFEQSVRNLLGMKRFRHVKIFRAKRNKSRFALDVVNA
jgi:hypothetical protein